MAKKKNVSERVKPKEELQPRNKSQEAYMNAIMKNQLIFGLGPSGVGKTFIAVTMAAQELEKGQIDRFIISRPSLPTERTGFLPGNEYEKFGPYFAPIRDILEKRFSPGDVNNLLKEKVIDIQPLAFLRGRNFDNSWVFLDEAQNADERQMKLFLTRIGERAKVIVDGDLDQIDLPPNEPSGLEKAVRILRKEADKKSSPVEIVNFSTSDIVRSKLVKLVLESWNS